MNEHALVQIFSTDTIVIRVELFLRVLSENKSISTVKTYGRALGIFTLWVDELGGRIELTQKNLELFPVYLRHRRKVTPRTVQTYLTALKKFFEFLSSEGLLQEDPAKDIKLKTKIPRNSRDFLTSDEIERILHVSKSKDQISLRDQAILLLMLLEGLAEGDISKCNYGDLENTLMGIELRIWTKSGPICIPLHSRTVTAITDYLATRERPSGNNTPLFCTHGSNMRDERITTRSVRSRMRILLDQANINREDISPQSLSYTAVYLQIQNGITREDLRTRHRPLILFRRIDSLKEKGLIDSSF